MDAYCEKRVSSSTSSSSFSLGGAAEMACVVWGAVGRGEEESAVVFDSVGVLVGGRDVQVSVIARLRLVTMVILRYNAFYLTTRLRFSPSRVSWNIRHRSERKRTKRHNPETHEQSCLIVISVIRSSPSPPLHSSIPVPLRFSSRSSVSPTHSSSSSFSLAQRSFYPSSISRSKPPPSSLQRSIPSPRSHSASQSLQSSPHPIHASCSLHHAQTAA